MGLTRVSLKPQKAIEGGGNAASGQQDRFWGRGLALMRPRPLNHKLIYGLSWKTHSVFKGSAETLMRLLLWALISCRVRFIVYRSLFPLSQNRPTNCLVASSESRQENKSFTDAVHPSLASFINEQSTSNFSCENGCTALLQGSAEQRQLWLT